MPSLWTPASQGISTLQEMPEDTEVTNKTFCCRCKHEIIGGNEGLVTGWHDACVEIADREAYERWKLNGRQK